MKTRVIASTLFLSTVIQIISAQQILLDESIKAGELTFFPELKDPNTYYYLSDKVSLSYRADGTPEFSFFRYVEGDKTKNSSIQTIREGTGGGIIHMIIKLEVPEEMLEEATRALKSKNPNAIVKGPAVFDSGKFALVSSFATANGELSTQLIGVGPAPILDGHKAAVSLQLTKQGAKLLWEIFKTPTPDISFSFEMALSGYRSPIEAKLEADFDQIYKHRTFDVGVATPILQGEIKGAFDELTRNGAIKYTGVEADEKMESLIELAYQKLTEMMMEPMTSSTTDLAQLTQQESMLDKASQMLKSEREAAERRNENNRNEPQLEQVEKLPAISIAASYRMKEITMKGKFEVSFNKYMQEIKTFNFAENIGRINCKSCFYEINLDEIMFFKQRDIRAFFDGLSAKDFENYINYVTVILRKLHQNGKITTREIVIDRTKFNDSGNNFTISYGVNGDNSYDDWLKYEYEIVWNFFGDHEVKEQKVASYFNGIMLTPPYRKRTIELQSDPIILKEHYVRLVTVKIYYKLDGKDYTVVETINPSTNVFAKPINYTTPTHEYAYEYEISWRLRDGKTIESGRKKGESSFLFVDEIKY